jgi:hypothetical protein
MPHQEQLVCLQWWGRRFACPWSFYIFSGSGSADELLFCCLELEFLQKFGVFGHFLA